MERLTLTPTEAGQLLGLGRNSTYDAIRRGQIRSIRLGRRILIPRSEITRILAECDRNTMSPGATAPITPERD
ncbi:MAG: helix-turn-helix domain-containing protein [Bryobacteraceae bacterium]